jgi:hypothetical protein
MMMMRIIGEEDDEPMTVLSIYRWLIRLLFI